MGRVACCDSQLMLTVWLSNIQTSLLIVVFSTGLVGSIGGISPVPGGIKGGTPKVLYI